MTIEDINNKIQAIDSRVSYLEQVNDKYIVKNGVMNTGIYNQIQKLMDERDRLFIKKLSMGGL